MALLRPTPIFAARPWLVGAIATFGNWRNSYCKSVGLHLHLLELDVQRSQQQHAFRCRFGAAATKGRAQL